MGKSGRRLFSIPLKEESIKRWGAPYLHIHRADYIEALEKALKRQGNNSIRLGSEVIGYHQDANTVTVTFANGETIHANALLGADGIHSTIRTIMLGEEAPNFTGNVAWRIVVPTERLGDVKPAPTACVWMGAGRHCVTYQLRNGELANLVAVVERDDWIDESWSQKGSREEAMADFQDWHPTITKLIQEADVLHRWALFDRAPLTKWIDGRVALLGDAAHPMLPFLAQGAAMAVEDAWAVSTKLAKGVTGVENALEQYQALRYQRATHVQSQSRANAKTFHQQTLYGQMKTYGPMWLAGRLAPRAVHKRQDYLYGYDITAM